ncbi:DMT family transporter [Rhodobacter sp. KR11]|uniref:DMT family transporter n=1 Tax=Rhodobacter sp. KR11 TaxID=2974588 RepID=UPI002222CACF|nr:DMT family transporter [Rhodobacter sp. KR11]MCW1917476.1 DMT family transporter [Rhodobacter sp. KR11]
MSPTRPLWLTAAPVLFLLLWSAGFPIAKIGIAHAEPMTILALRYTAVLVLLAPLALILRPPMPRTFRAGLDVAVTGFLIQVVYFGLCYLAFKSGTSSGTVAIVVCLQPILVALLAPRFAGEKVSPRTWVGLALGLLGAGTVILSHAELKTQGAFGLICTAIALCGMTGAALYEKRFGVTQHPITANLIQYAVGAAVTLPLALATESTRISWDGEFLAVMAYLVLGNSLLAISLLLAMIRAGEVARVSALFYLVPPLAALFAWPLLGEALAPLGWAGMGLAAVGVGLASRRAP